MVETSSNYINQKKVKRDIKKREKAEKKIHFECVCVDVSTSPTFVKTKKAEKGLKKKHKKMKRGKKPDIKKI